MCLHFITTADYNFKVNNEFEKLCISVQIIREFIAVKSKITFLDGCYNASEIVLDINEFEENYLIYSNNLAVQKELLRLLKISGKGKTST